MQRRVAARERRYVEACADARIEIVQGVDAREVRLFVRELAEHLRRHRRGVELDADALVIVADLGDFLWREAIVQAHSRDAEHTKFRRRECLEAEDVERLRAHVRDNFHVVRLCRAQERADFLLERVEVALGDVHGREDALDAGGSGFLDEREIFLDGVVEARINGNAIVQMIRPFLWE